MASTYPIILYDNRFSTGAIEASTVASGYSGENIRDGRTYTYWASTNSGTATIQVDTSKTTCKANCAAVISHNLKTKNSTIYIEHSADATNWTGVATVVPADDNAFMVAFTEATNRYWRIRVNSGSTGPKIGVVMVGSKMQFGAKPTIPVTRFSASVETETQQSKAGHILGSIVRYKPLNLSFAIPPWEDNATWYNSTYRNFWEDHGSEKKPFFFAYDLDFFSSDIFYVTLDNPQYAMPQSLTSRVDAITLNMTGVME